MPRHVGVLSPDFPRYQYLITEKSIPCNILVIVYVWISSTTFDSSAQKLKNQIKLIYCGYSMFWLGAKESFAYLIVCIPNSSLVLGESIEKARRAYTTITAAVFLRRSNASALLSSRRSSFAFAYVESSLEIAFLILLRVEGICLVISPSSICLSCCIRAERLLCADRLRAERLRADRLRAERLRADRLRADRLRADRLRLSTDCFFVDFLLLASHFFCLLVSCFVFFCDPCDAPFCDPFVAPFCNPFIAPFIAPFVAPFCNPFVASFCNPFVAPPVAFFSFSPFHRSKLKSAAD